MRRRGGRRPAWAAVLVVVTAVGTLAVVPAAHAVAPVADPPARRAITSDDRVLAIGDSMLASLREPLGRRLSAAGITHRIDAVSGSGLGGSLYYQTDWISRTRDDVAAFEPTVVLVEFCCNWWRPYPTDENGSTIALGTSAFRRYWERRAREIAEIATAGGADLWWVVTPPSAVESTNHRAIDPINDTTFAQVLSPGPGGAAPSLIRWDLALSNGTGRYTPTLVIDGITTPVRERDGLHFLPAGAELLAEFTFDQMRGAPSPPTPWGPFPSMGVITRYLLERTFGQVPYDYDAVRPLARPLRNGDEDWRAHIVRLVDSRRWGRTASPVARLYRAAFGRAPDAGGLTYWTRSVAQRGRSLDAVAASFLRASESVARYGTSTNAEFVTRLYRNVLARDPDAGGADYWAARLEDGDSRADLLRRFADSAENRRASAASTNVIVAEVGLTGSILGPVPAWGEPGPSLDSIVRTTIDRPEFQALARAYVPAA